MLRCRAGAVALVIAVLAGIPGAASAAEPAPFADVPADAYYAEAVAWAHAGRIVTGLGPDRFEPHAATTRAQIVTMLQRYLRWRDGASPATGDAAEFVDLAPGAWYADAVRWAAGSGVTNGVGRGRFDPDGSTTRAQLATFVHRLAGSPGTSGGPPFFDVESGRWFSAPITWMAASGLTEGTSPGFFDPDRVATRAEVVTFLWRLAGEPAPGARFRSNTFTAVGDSIMRGAVIYDDLDGDRFAGWTGWVDAGDCRKAVVEGGCTGVDLPSTLSVLETAVAEETIGETVIIHTGTNGGLTAAEFDRLVRATPPTTALWFLNLSAPRGWIDESNTVIADGVARWQGLRRIRMLDWKSVAESDSSYLVADRIHVTPSGASAYVTLLAPIFTP